MILGYELHEVVDIVTTEYGPEPQYSHIFSNHSTFVHFQLCALFRNWMMFALGGAVSVSDGQGGIQKAE